MSIARDHGQVHGVRIKLRPAEDTSTSKLYVYLKQNDVIFDRYVYDRAAIFKAPA